MHTPSLLTFADVFHRRSTLSSPEKRQLYGNVFGTELPAYVIFHAMLGYTLIGIGLSALALRLPVEMLRRRRWLHLYLGYAWVFGTVWMPVTAIWCVYSFTGWDFVAFFIFSMFASIQLGWTSIKVFTSRQQKGSTQSGQTVSGPKFWKILHAIAMSYALIMLIGAGISFPFRANADYSRGYKENDRQVM